MARPINNQKQLRRELFISLGLTDKEAILYDIALESGRATGAELEKKSQLKKNTYALIDTLLKKKLIIPIKIDKRLFFEPAPPQDLAGLITKKEQEVSHAKNILTTLLPELQSNYRMAVGKPVVRFFEGPEGLKEVFQDIYQPDNPEIYGCVDLETVGKTFPEHITKELIPQRITNKTMAHGILGQSKESEELATHDTDHLRRTVLFDKTKYPLPAEVEIYKDKVALMSFAQGQYMALIIENKDFATSLQSIFSFIFDHHYTKK